MSRISYMILLSCLCCLSCSKDREIGNYYGEYELSGYVRDKITLKPIPYALVGVVAHGRGEFSDWGDQGVATGRSDQNGKYTLKFFVDSKKSKYEILAQALQYYEMSSGGNEVIFTKNGKKNQDVILMPHGYLTLFFKGGRGGSELSVNLWGIGGPFRHGKDTFETTYVAPDRKINFTYWVEYSDTSLNYKKTIKLPPPLPHDTAYYTIEF